MSYQLKLDVYEGPLDLLANLVSRQKVDIYEIPIAKITDEYLEYVGQMEVHDLEVSSEFVVIAATLLDMKAAALLPSAEEEYDEEDDISPQEARELLVARLIEYKKFKNVAAELMARYEAENKYYVRDTGIEEQFVGLIPDFLSGISLLRLTRLFMSINEKKEISLVQADHITPKPLSVDEYVKKVEAQLKGLKFRSFREVTLECGSKVEIITAFLAVLELYKRGLVELGQAETFGEITIIVADQTERIYEKLSVDRIAVANAFKDKAEDNNREVNEAKEIREISEKTITETMVEKAGDREEDKVGVVT